MSWLSDWAKRHKITLDSANIDSDLIYVPIPIFLGTSVGQSSQDVSDIFDEVGNNWQKIAVTDSTGNSQVYVEIEKWDATNEVAVLWVSRSDLTLTSSSDPVLYIYFDNNKSDNTSYVAGIGNRPEVYRDSIKRKYHFNGNAKDSAGNLDGSWGGTEQYTDGKVAQSAHFDGGSHVDSGFSETGTLSITAWLYSTGNSSGNRGFIVGATEGSSRGTYLYVDGQDIVWGTYSSTWYSKIQETCIQKSTWHRITAVRDESQGKSFLFCDGVLLNSVSEDWHPGTVPLYIGAENHDGTAEEYLAGYEDEVTLHTEAISSAREKFAYNSEIDNLITFGSLEAGGISVSTDSPTNVERKKATLNGTVDDPTGGYSSVDVYFEWGTTTSYGNTTPIQTISSFPSSFSADISGLSSLTEYHCRAVATDGSSYWYGSDTTFFTSDLQDVDEKQSDFQTGTLQGTVATINDTLQIQGIDLSVYNNVVYMSESGDDTNGDGSKDNPYKTWSTAYSNASAGDIIYIKAGTYTFTWADAYVCRTDERCMWFHTKDVDVIGENDSTVIVLDSEGNGSGDGSRAYGISCDSGVTANIYNLRAEMKGATSTTSYESSIFGSYSPTPGNLKLHNVAAINRDGSGLLYDNDDNTSIEFNHVTAIGESQQLSSHAGSPTWYACDAQYCVDLIGTTSNCNIDSSNQMTKTEWESYLSSVPADCENGSNDENPNETIGHIGIYGGPQAWGYGKAAYEFLYRTTQLDLSLLSTYSDSLIEWTATLNGQSLTIETRYSLDGGSTWSSWQTCTNGSALPGLSGGEDLSNALLECRQTLSTSDITATPELEKLGIYVTEYKSFIIALPVIRTEGKISVTGVGGSFSADYVITLPKIRAESTVSIQDLHMGYPHIVCNVQPERIASVMGIPAGSLDAVLNVN